MELFLKKSWTSAQSIGRAHRARSLLIVVFGVLLPLAYAEAAGKGNPFTAAINDTQTASTKAHLNANISIEAMVGRFISSALSLTGVFFFGYIVWAGYLWMTAHGEAPQVEKAKKMISNAIIGLAITLAAYFVSSFVVRQFETNALT